MEITFNKSNAENGKERRGYNDACLLFSVNDNGSLNLWHSNRDDKYYGYNFTVNGTKEELKIIKEFCDKITEAE